jgi:hypothetical protein
LFWGEQPPFTSLGRGGRYFSGDEKKTSNSESFREQAAQRPTFNLEFSKEMKHGRIPSTATLRARFSWAIALTLVALIVAATGIIIFLRLESWPARTAKQGTAELERLGKDLRSAFVDIAHLQPRITINNRVYLEQTTTTSELTVLSRRIEVEHEFAHKWAGSAKRIKLHGTFAVKAGFDLRQDLAVDVRPDEILVQLPRAQIVGVEQEQVDVLEFENGLWNKISGDDVKNELSILPQLARQKAEESGLPAQAERALEEQLTQRIHMPQPLRVVFASPIKSD